MTTATELGTKHECPNCSAKYYDMGKSDPTCPKCGANEAGELPETEEESAEEK